MASKPVDVDRGRIVPVMAIMVPSRRRDEIREPVQELKRRDLHDAARAWLRRLSLPAGAEPDGSLVSREPMADAVDAIADT